MSTLILISVLFLTLLFGMPIAFCIGVAAVAFLLVEGSIPPQITAQTMVNGLDSYNVIAIPFFILAAQIMNYGGSTKKLMEFAGTLVGHLRGGLAHVNILTSILFAGMSGSAVADSAGLGQTLIPAMKRKGYGADFSAAVTAASSTIGPIIPPSVPIVIYGILAETSISRLFLAGAVPGLLMGITMIVLSYFLAVRKRYPAQERSTMKEIGRSFLSVLPALLTPAIILGGMWGGIFSPTEAAAVAVGYAALQGFTMGDLRFRDLWKAMESATMYSAVIMIIVASANLFAWILSIEQIPVRFSEGMLGLTENPILILLIINLFLLIAGCFMEILAIMLMTVPVLLPLVTRIGIDPVHFGIVMVLNLMIGLLSPPFGLSLHIAKDIAGISYLSAIRAVIPFLILLLGLLVLVTYLPWLVLALPNALG